MKQLKDMFTLEGKVAIITGAAGNIGIVHAETLAELGCKLILVDIIEEKVKEIAEDISKRYNAEAIGIKIDLSDEESIKEAFQQAFETLGRIDILINNAQFTCEGDNAPVETYDPKIWNRTMEVNVTGAFLCSKHAIKYMHGGGVILNMGSVMGVIAPDRRIYDGSGYEGKPMNSPLVYTASKASIIGLTKYLAVDFAKKNIRVNCISPAGFEDEGQTELFKSKYKEKIPMERIANKEELKGAVAFLCTNASSFVTGHNLILDGGMSSW